MATTAKQTVPQRNFLYTEFRYIGGEKIKQKTVVISEADAKVLNRRYFVTLKNKKVKNGSLKYEKAAKQPEGLK